MPDFMRSLKQFETKFTVAIEASLHSEDQSDKYFSNALNRHALVMSSINQDLEEGVLTQNDNAGHDIVYPDWFNHNDTKAVYKQAIEDLLHAVPFDGLSLVDNTGPVGKCTGECPTRPSSHRKLQENESNANNTIKENYWWWGYSNQDEVSTWYLPFVPGISSATHYDHLDYKTASLNATHPSNNLTEYDLHNLFGHAQGKIIHEILSETQNETLKNKLQFLISEGSFSGSGQYMGHSINDFRKSNIRRDNIRGLMSSMMSFQMFGMPFTGPKYDTIDNSRDFIQQNRTAQFFQLSAFSPLARYHDKYWWLPENNTFNYGNTIPGF
jgi:hypothetical protein